MNFKKTWKRFMNMSRSREGFTLVELIVVIAILAILAGVAIPVYSGYITKANEAADQQLLGTINTAFGAACIENGFAVQSVTAADLAVSNKQVGALSNVASSTTTVDQDKLNTSFQKYLAGNALTFKTIEALTFNAGEHVFVVAGATTSPWTGFFDGLDFGNSVSNVKNSTFGTIGAGGLMEKVDTVTGLAAGLAEVSPAFRAVLEGSSADMAAALGYDLSVEADAQAYGAKLMEMVNQIAPGTIVDGQITDTTAFNKATTQIYANYAVLQTAGSTAQGDPKTLVADLKTNMANGYIDDVSNMLNPSQSADVQKQGMADAAMIYAMYTAYANQLPADDPNKKDAMAAAENISTFVDVVGNTEGAIYAGFQDYLGKPQAEADMKGYLGALDIINKSVEGDETGAAVTDLLVNGYNNTGLINGLQGLLGK